MINVLNDIKDLLVFNSEDDFYFLQIIQRKKENKELGSNSKVIKNYYIENVEYIERKMPEIIQICNLFNARAMLRLNKRSYKKVAFKTLQNMANSISNGEYKFVGKSYDRAVGQSHNDKNKKWILDIDHPVSDSDIMTIISVINDLKPDGNKLIKVLPTKNGTHLITKPFDISGFNKLFDNIDIHKDNPINLYIP